jgi:hypothetical protein
MYLPNTTANTVRNHTISCDDKALDLVQDSQDTAFRDPILKGSASRNMQRMQKLVNLSVLVDSNGAVSFEPMTAVHDSLRSSKGTLLERIDLTGCIEWSGFGQTVRIQFRPSLTTSAARDTVLRWLQCDLKRRVHLRFWQNGSWQDEIVGNFSLAADRIDQLVFQSGGGNDGLLIRRSKSRVEADSIQIHRDMLAFWIDRKDTFSLKTDFPALSSITSQRAILLRLDSDSGYVVEEAGLRLPSGLRRWMFNKQSQQLSDFPDHLYAKHLREVYDMAAESLEPVVDQVDGLIKFPGVPRQRYSYHRVILPLKISNTDYVIASTIKDDAIDLFH